MASNRGRNSKRGRTDDNEEINKTKKQSLEESENQQLEDSQVHNYWLIKSEPESRFENGIDMKFSFNDLKSSKNQTTYWDGVRNYEARKHLKSMKLNQKAFFYHSNCKNPGIIGIVTIDKEAYTDHTQFDSTNPHYDSKSTKTNPKWFMVDVKYERDLKRFISLAELKKIYLKQKSLGKGELINSALFTKSRLSVQPINDTEWNFIINLENQIS